MSAVGVSFALTRSGLTVTERLVLVALCHKLRDNQRVYKLITSMNALVKLLELPEKELTKSLNALRKKEIIAWKSIVHQNKTKTEVLINVIDPFVEDHQQLVADKKLELVMDMFNNQFWKSYPRNTMGRENAWKAFSALPMTEDLFFKIMEDLANRLEGEWSSGAISQIPTANQYITGRLWEKPGVPAVAIINHIAKKAEGTARGTRLSPDWQLPRAWGEWAMEHSNFTGQEILEIAEQFRDYWIARSDSGAIKLNWHATWRNWIRSPLNKKRLATFAEQTRDFKETRGKEVFNHLGNASTDTLKAWGL
jgi:hypothetical protein